MSHLSEDLGLRDVNLRNFHIEFLSPVDHHQPSEDVIMCP
jgi:hypothetical protein